MMTQENLLLNAVVVPVAGAFVLPLAGRLSERFRNVCSLAVVAASLVFSFSLIPSALAGKAVTLAKDGPLGINLVLVADPLAVFMACVSSLISAVIVLYSFGYISHYENQNEYYSMVVLFFGAMMGLIFSGNLILLYVFWEITAITSWRLIGFFREKEHVLRADKAFLVTVFGALVMLIGFLGLYHETGSFDLAVIKEALKNNPVSDLCVGLILVGILSKSATLPFQTWLPDAGVAPSPVTALLHAAVLVKIGVYVFARLFLVTLPLTAFWHTAVPVIAALSTIVSAGAALVETDLKRIIAYSTISQIGFIFFGLATGNPIGIAGGLLYILMHGLAKAGLFLCAGVIEQKMKVKDITKLGGLIVAMPFTAVSFLFCALSVMGVPPFGGFFSKYMVFAGAIAGGRLFISALFLIGAFMTVLYLWRTFNMVFLGEAQRPVVREGDRVMLVSIALLALLSLVGGLLIIYPSRFAEAVVAWSFGVMQ